MFVIENFKYFTRYSYQPDKLYILKKNVQRQEGIKITSDLNTLLNSFKDSYIIIQELLQNPFLVNILLP